jgi:hypothetical protein
VRGEKKIKKSAVKGKANAVKVLVAKGKRVSAAAEEVPVSQRAFAEMMGVDEKNVREAIEKGKISKAALVPAGTRTLKGKNPGENRVLQMYKIIPSIAKVDWAKNLNINQSKSEALVVALDIPKERLLTKDDLDGKSLGDLQCIRLAVDIREAELELAVKEGKYIEKELADRAYMAAAITFRNEMESMPNAIADKIIKAGDNRELVVKIMADEICDRLRGLSKVPEVLG